MLITDPAYHLPYLTATEYVETFETGANLPGGVFARDKKTRQRKKCVVKFRGGERMTIEACARELLSSFIAKQWGIRVVEPVLVDVSHSFAELQLGKPHYQRVKSSIGLNYGSIYIPGYETIPVQQSLSITELPQAQHIFLFDLFIQNSDRRVGKPNLMASGQELVIYDHELAFGFTMDIFKNPCPYELRDRDRKWIEQLFLWSKIRKFPLPESAIEDSLSKLDTVFWNKAFELIPPEWHTAQLNEIRNYLTEIVDNAPRFIKSVKTYLA